MGIARWKSADRVNRGQSISSEKSGAIPGKLRAGGRKRRAQMQKPRLARGQPGLAFSALAVLDDRLEAPAPELDDEPAVRLVLDDLTRLAPGGPPLRRAARRHAEQGGDLPVLCRERSTASQDFAAEPLQARARPGGRSNVKAASGPLRGRYARLDEVRSEGGDALDRQADQPAESERDQLLVKPAGLRQRLGLRVARRWPRGLLERCSGPLETLLDLGPALGRSELLAQLVDLGAGLPAVLPGDVGALCRAAPYGGLDRHAVQFGLDLLDRPGVPDPLELGLGRLVVSLGPIPGLRFRCALASGVDAQLHQQAVDRQERDQHQDEPEGCGAGRLKALALPRQAEGSLDNRALGEIDAAEEGREGEPRGVKLDPMDREWEMGRPAIVEGRRSQGRAQADGAYGEPGCGGVTSKGLCQQEEGADAL
jgi:hypothetical protein